jgi:acyl-CoA synthetase (AMP-forming)/AMP-acid ligase II
MVSNRKMDPDSSPNIVGRPFNTASAIILQPDGLRVSSYGAIGELCVTGPQLVKRYLKRPDETEKASINHRGGRIYRTGDLARWLPNGQLELFGRKDWFRTILIILDHFGFFSMCEPS